jgi:hypothetical protein
MRLSEAMGRQSMNFFRPYMRNYAYWPFRKCLKNIPAKHSRPQPLFMKLTFA